MIETIKCPYCNNLDCIADHIFESIESHGTGIFNVPCLHCQKMIYVYGSVEVVIHTLRKSNAET